jgi:hypothetical protein
LALIWAHVPYPSQAASALHDKSGAQMPDGAALVAEDGP